MSYFFNRIFFSYYCMEYYSYKLLFPIFLPVYYLFGKIIYERNPFNFIDKKKCRNFNVFMVNKRHTLDVVLSDLDFGASITRSKASYVFTFVPYMMLFAALLKYATGWTMPNGYFEVALLLSFCVSYFVCYIFSFRDDVYKVYFQKCSKKKSMKKWIIVAMLLFLGAIASVILSIIYWNK